MVDNALESKDLLENPLKFLHIHDLPPEILTHIFSFLNFEQGENFAPYFVCILWRDLLFYLALSRKSITRISEKSSKHSRISRKTITIKEYAKRGYLSLVQWYLTKAIDLADRNKVGMMVSHLSANHGHRHILVWLKEQSIAWGSTVCESAARGGHLELLQWLRENNCSWHASIYEHAAYNGHVNILQWLKDKIAPLNLKFLDVAAKRGHVNVFKWAKENCLFAKSNSYTIHAIRGGHVDVLEWLFEQRLPINNVIYLVAAKHGHLNVIKWAHSKKIQWNPKLYYCVCIRKDQEMFKWLKENGAPYNSFEVNAMLLKSNNLEAIEWFRVMRIKLN